MSWLSDATGINIDVAGALGHIRDDFNNMFEGGNILTDLANIITTEVGTSLEVGDIGGVGVIAGSQGVQNFLETNALAKSLGGTTLGNFGGAINALSSGVQINNLTAAEQQGLTGILAAAAAITTAGALAPAVLPSTVGGVASDIAATKAVISGVQTGNVGQIALAAGGALSGIDESGTVSDVVDAASGVNAATGGALTKQPSTTTPQKPATVIPIRPPVTTAPAPAPSSIPTTAAAAPQSSAPLLIGGAVLAKIALFS